jgi:hypothetical protein
MSETVNIYPGDLHLAISAAFTRGRYVLMTGGDGQPREITIDLRERPDDLFTAEDAAIRTRRERAAFVPSGDPASVYDWTPTDDHGPAIPAQVSRIETPFGAVEGVVTNADGSPDPVVYEFELREADPRRMVIFPPTLDTVIIDDAPDKAAAARADWVHVYDRVTRERRTLKRPEPDAILTGLQDVAADLRAR